MRVIQSMLDRGCLFIFLVMVVNLIYRYISNGQYDQFNCDTLLSRGEWLDLPCSSQDSSRYNTWSPPTCMMHSYRANDIRQCIGERKIVLIGDSRVRQIFWAVAMKLDRKKAETEMTWANRHNNVTFRGAGNLTVEFIWDPYLNSTTLFTELARVSSKDATVDGGSEASIIMIGGGLWFAKDLSDFALQRFSESVGNILRTLGADVQKNREVDALPEILPQRDRAASLVVFAPVPEPCYASLDSTHSKILTPARIQPLREKMLEAWHLRRFPVLWAFDLMTEEQPRAFQPDGLHVLDNVADSMADLMLNVKCNDVLTQSRRYPADKTCCSKYSQLNWTQGMFIFIAWSSFLVSCLLPLVDSSIVIFARGRAGKQNLALRQLGPFSIIESWLSGYFPSRKILKAIAILFLVSYYCWWADRTPLLNKLQKQYSGWEFMTLCSVTVVAGLLSTYQSSPSTQQKNTHSEGPFEASFLPRDQTDEWKGWMQFIILIYHYTGASRVLWIYKIARLLVASYLFLTGYGHTIFFYEKADYSLKRVAGVLLRLNMLSCILPFVMKTDYMFYYFAPLVSFWYLVVYSTMAIGKSCNKTPVLIILKIMTSAVVMTAVIFHWPGLFESTFLLLAKLCNIHWDPAEWQFRLKLDNYIVYFGMLVGLCTVTNKGRKTIYCTRSEDDNKVKAPRSSVELIVQPLSAIFDSWLRHRRGLYLAITLVGCLLYAHYAYSAKDKAGHNETFSMVSFGPVLAFAAIRNSFLWTRRYHSVVFAWMGRYSLETFILQYHIWLAADTKGILSTGFFQTNRKVGKWADFALLTVLFLWVCWHVACATQVLTAYIVEPKSMQEVGSQRQDLPRTRSDESPEERHSDVPVNRACRTVPKLVVGWLNYCSNGLQGFVAKHLWTRLQLILLVLWLLNLTYP